MVISLRLVSINLSVSSFLGTTLFLPPLSYFYYPPCSGTWGGGGWTWRCTHNCSKQASRVFFRAQARVCGQWVQGKSPRRGSARRGGGEQGSKSQVGPSATPARSPPTDLADYFDAPENPDILHLIEQDAAVAGTSTPSSESLSDQRGE